MTKLTPTPEGQKPLYVVEVPKYTEGIIILKPTYRLFETIYEGEKESSYMSVSKESFKGCKIIGTATLEGNTAVTDFDVESYLIKVMAGFSNYSKSPGYFVEPNKSFASLLRANGCTNTEVKYVILQEV